MTDKVQKIREEVERLMYGYNLEADIASCEDAETEELANIKYQLCKKILDYIDKVQEEPVSEPNKELAETYLAVFDKKFPILPSLSGKQLSDYKNFLNKCQQIFGLKEWGIRPVQSKLFEKLTLLWAAWGAEHLQGIGRQDEKEQDIPVSEDLDIFASEYVRDPDNWVDWIGPHGETDDISYIIKAIKAGAKWQKEKKEPVSEDLEKAADEYADGENPTCPCEECLIKTFKAGAKWQKEQMMANAIDAEVLENYDGKVIEYNEATLDEKLSNCKVFDKVKVVVIKED